MEILGIGPLELFFIILLALIILGPKDLEKTGKSIAKGLNNLIRSDNWNNIRLASDKVKSLPSELMREAGMEEMKKTLETEVIQPVKDAQKSVDSWASYSARSDSTKITSIPTESSPENTDKTTPSNPNEERSE